MMQCSESKTIWREIRARQDRLRSEQGGCPSRMVLTEAINEVLCEMALRDLTPTEYMEQLESRAVEAVNGRT